MSSAILRQLCMGVSLKRKRLDSEKQPQKIVEVCTNTRELDPGKLKGKPEKVQNRLRTHYGIGIWGDDIPALLTDFSALPTRYGCSQQLVDNIASCGYVRPTPVQMAIIPAMLERREVVACAPTGSGKTASFLIPLIHLLGASSKEGFRAIVVCHTRELAKQTYREVMKLAEGTGLRPYVLTKTSNAQRRFSSERSASLDLMVTTPNRLVWLLRETKLSLSHVQYLVIDESDRLFEAGKSGFREQLEKIYAACAGGKLRRALFSATSTKDLDRWCRLQLDAPIAVAVGAKNSATKQVDQKLVFVGNESGKLYELRQIIRNGVKPPMLIFVETKTSAQQLYEHLALDGLSVDMLHAGRTASDRDRIIDNFRLGKVLVLICSELAGRGIDFKGVDLVVNYDFPQSAAAYIHRIGRTGRAGCTGRALTFFTENDAPKLREIVQVVRKAGCEVPEYMLKLNPKRLKNLVKTRRDKVLKNKNMILEKDDTKPNKKSLANRKIKRLQTSPRKTHTNNEFTKDSDSDY
ncbi:putative ATP-dependent RNA helicase DDX52-like [Tropilaelaps mercedesae]|uniref:Probable ATP-dependent RNA helicase DDX52 n=1 Tax=Tropilaelaps mercedesae TaxID=418985 RepID=A0A1V9XW06_9ACAR|nr:putative ATP-dependent RNA helicase DDX52-like [Tropilaelaps mercedesae]